MYLGMDLGTSGLKGLIVDASGNAVASASAQYDVIQPFPNWSEQNPDDWVRAAKSILNTLRDTHPDQLVAVRAISFSGQMHGAVVVNDHGAPLRPCILWNDMRCDQEAAIMDATADVRDLSANIVFPGFTAPKLLWMQKHEPELFAQTHKVLLPKDYLRYWFCERFAMDMSDAAGTSWLDVAARDWSDTLLSAGRMRRNQMPDLVEGCDIVGLIREDIAREYGLSANTKIVAGGGDNAVAACGVGAVNEGQGFVSLGTSGVLLAAKDGFSSAPASAVHTFCHAVPNRWYQMGVSLSAANSLNWLAQTLNTDAKSLSALCDRPISGPSNVIFLPYLTGERTPHNDANIGGAFIGLKADTTPTDLCQAVMEGVAFALRDCLEALRSTGTELTQILAIGGGTNSVFWLESLASILNLELALPEQGDFGGALGAARLAMIADGADIKTTFTAPAIKQIIHPSPELQAEYETAYRRFKKIYPLLKDL